MFDVYTLIFLAVIAAIALFFWFDRKNVKRESIFLLRKTTKGTAFLTWLGKRFPRLWWVYGSLAIVLGFYFSILFTASFLQIILGAFATQTAPAVGGFILPTPTQDAVALPGVIGIPILSWIIIIFVLIIVHEGSHAVMAVREGVKIKTMGWGLFTIMPVAFVEPDEEQLKKEKPMKQLRVYASGSLGNFVIAFIFVNILALSVLSFYTIEPGVRFSGYMEGFPAQEANLTGLITNIDGVAIDNAQNLSDYLNEVGPGERITITTLVPGSDGEDETATFSLVTVENPGGGDGGFIGITNLYSNSRVREGADPELAKFLYGRDPFGSNIGGYGFIFWMYLINMAIGCMNVLPGFPFDGGRMWKIIFDKYIPKYSMGITKVLSIFVWALIAIMFGFAFFGGSTLF